MTFPKARYTAGMPREVRLCRRRRSARSTRVLGIVASLCIVLKALRETVASLVRSWSRWDRSDRSTSWVAALSVFRCPSPRVSRPRGRESHRRLRRRCVVRRSGPSGEPDGSFGTIRPPRSTSGPLGDGFGRCHAYPRWRREDRSRHTWEVSRSPSRRRCRPGCRLWSSVESEA